MKIVTMDTLNDESDIESVTEVVVDDETTLNSTSEEISTFDDLENLESPDPSIQVFQEVRPSSTPTQKKILTGMVGEDLPNSARPPGS